MARAWSSPPGNLYASLLLINPGPAHLMPQLGFVAAVALVESINSLLGAASAQLKWPNDLLIGGAKAAGILIEATNVASGRFACVVGFGVNCESHPETTPYAATSLAKHGGPREPGAVFVALSAAFPRCLERWAGGAGFAMIRRDWLAGAHAPGCPLRVRVGDVITEGEFVTLDAQGRLILACNGAMRAFDAGDVFPVSPEHALCRRS